MSKACVHCVKIRGIIGTPLLEIHTHVLRATTCGEWIEVHTSVEQWGVKVFRHRRVFKRGGDVLCEGTEVRTFAIRDPETAERARSIPISEDIKAACL